MWINAVLFQLGWFACVLERGIIAVALTLLILFAHGWLQKPSRGEWRAIGLIAGIGTVQDVILMQLDVMRFDTHPWPPLWLVCLWLLFATTLNHSLRWLSQRWLLAAALGAIAGPLSYLAGERLGALSLNHAMLPLLAFAWALGLPLFYYLLHQLKEPLPSCHAPSD